MTAREQRVAGEILRIAREDLSLEGRAPEPRERLAGRLDSLALLSLVVAVEDRFRVILSDDEAAQATTLEELARLVALRSSPEVFP